MSDDALALAEVDDNPDSGAIAEVATARQLNRVPTVDEIKKLLQTVFELKSEFEVRKRERLVLQNRYKALLPIANQVHEILKQQIRMAALKAAAAGGST